MQKGSNPGSYQAGYDQGYHDAAALALELYRQQEQELTQLRQEAEKQGAIVSKLYAKMQYYKAKRR